jgi:hypothetical protein
VLDSLELAILIAVDRLTRETHGETDSEAVGELVEQMGHELPAEMIYGRMFMSLRKEGYLAEVTTRTGGGKVVMIELTPQGRAAARADVDPAQEVYAENRRLLSSEGFAAAYADAFKAWAEAEKLLFGDSPETQLATIGFKLRDATQSFATALVNEHKPPGVETSVTAVSKRLKSVIDMHKAELGTRRPKVLEAMMKLWEADIDLIQRQTHGNERGEGLMIGDGRRVVSLTMLLMVEFATILDEVEPPSATLAGG